MALPLMIFGLLCLASLIIIILGFLNIANEKGVALIPLGGLGFLLTGVLLWTNGLELNQVASINTSTEIISYTYTVLTVSDGSPLWLLANIVFFGGFLLMLIGFGKILQMKKQEQEDSKEYF